METFQGVTTILAGVVAVLAAIFSVVAVITLLKYKTETLERTEESIRSDVKEVKEAVGTLTTLVKVQGAEQQIMHNINTKTLEAITLRVEKLEEQVSKWRS